MSDTRADASKGEHSKLPFVYQGQTRMIILSMSEGIPNRQKWYTIEAKMPPRFILTNDIAYTRSEADAQYIVRACNAYPAMLAALERIANGPFEHSRVTSEQKSQLAQAALRMARGEGEK